MATVQDCRLMMRQKPRGGISGLWFLTKKKWPMLQLQAIGTKVYP